MRVQKTQLLLTLLAKSEIFDEKAKAVIRASLSQETLPEHDSEYLLHVFEVEQNIRAVIDQRADTMIESLRKKYGVSSAKSRA